nr:hypothetical protein [Tanacetum cinerariifolium]
MRLKDFAKWDKGTSTWVCWGEVCGTVPVGEGVQEGSVGKMGLLKHAPPSPNYVPGLEHPPSPDYVPGLEYPEYVAPADEEISVEDQPLPADALPATLSLGYVA